MVKIAGYIRQGLKEDKELLGLHNQEEKINAFARAKGWKLYRIYQDVGFSVENLNREGTKELIQDAKDKKFEAIVVSKLDRLGRSTRELLEFAELCKQNGVDIISLAETIDTTTPQGYLFFTLVSAFEQFERETTYQKC